MCWYSIGFVDLSLYTCKRHGLLVRNRWISGRSLVGLPAKYVTINVIHCRGYYRLIATLYKHEMQTGQTAKGILLPAPLIILRGQMAKAKVTKIQPGKERPCAGINNYHEHLPHGIRLCPTSSLVCSPPQTEPRGQHHELALHQRLLSLHHAVKNPLVTAAGRPLSLSDGRIWFRRSFLHAESTTRQCVSPAHTHTIDLNVVALLGPWVPVCGCFYRRPAAPWTRCGASCSAAMHQLRSCLALAGLPPAGASRTSPSTATASS